MGYVNLPPDLQGIFQDISNRVDKLENAQRFTLPNVPIRVTAATGNGTTVTYTARNNFLAGQTVTISGLGIASGSSLNLANVTIASATATGFTVTNSTTGVSAGTGQAVAITSSVGGLSLDGDPALPRIGDQWLNMANNTINFVDARGYLGQMFSTYAMKASDTDFALGVNSNRQNVFGSLQITLQPYRTYRIEAMVSATWNQTSTASLSSDMGIYVAISNPWTWGSWNTVMSTNDSATGTVYNASAASIGHTSVGANAGTSFTVGIVQTGATAVPLYPYVFLGTATNYNTPVAKAGCYLSVTSLGNSSNVQVGPWA